MILNIETSSKTCSVALCEGGDVYYQLISDTEMDHSSKLAPFVDECIKQLHMRERRLDAVAVSMGPGSYTGLRIGLSLAKGLCFGLNIPLIGINTLKILAVKGMFSSFELPQDTIFIPMIDARRMEVYTAAYDLELNDIMSPTPLILDAASYSQFEGRPILIIGDGVRKAQEILQINVMKWMDTMPLASDMNALSERAFRQKEFIDIAYSTPFYLKNFQATTPKNKL